jgi:hypothetical protein
MTTQDTTTVNLTSMWIPVRSTEPMSIFATNSQSSEVIERKDIKCDYSYEVHWVYYDINHISPLLEMKRYKLMIKLKEECQSVIDKVCPCVRISNILPRWIMLQFGVGDYFKDPLFPENASNNSQIIRDLLFLSKGALNDNNIDQFMEKLALKSRCNRILVELREFVDSSLYINMRNQGDVLVKKKGQMTYMTFDGLTLKINTSVAEKIEVNYKDDSRVGITSQINVNSYIMCVLMRYNTLDSSNQQLSANPRFYRYLKQHYGVDFELFGSAINTIFDNYCSLFSDLDKKANGFGTFNNLTMTRGFYVANPPYDEQIMINMTTKIIDTLHRSEMIDDGSRDDLTFIVIIPVWEDPDYGYNESLRLMEKSPYMTGCVRVNKTRSKFFNYATKQYINPCDVYIISLQNKHGLNRYTIPLEDIIRETYGG